MSNVVPPYSSSYFFSLVYKFPPPPPPPPLLFYIYIFFCFTPSLFVLFRQANARPNFPRVDTDLRTRSHLKCSPLRNQPYLGYLRLLGGYLLVVITRPHPISSAPHGFWKPHDFQAFLCPFYFPNTRGRERDTLLPRRRAPHSDQHPPPPPHYVLSDPHHRKYTERWLAATTITAAAATANTITAVRGPRKGARGSNSDGSSGTGG